MKFANAILINSILASNDDQKIRELARLCIKQDEAIEEATSVIEKMIDRLKELEGQQ